jgi:hypothetical protein
VLPKKYHFVEYVITSESDFGKQTKTNGHDKIYHFHKYFMTLFKKH